MWCPKSLATGTTSVLAADRLIYRVLNLVKVILVQNGCENRLGALNKLELKFQPFLDVEKWTGHLDMQCGAAGVPEVILALFPKMFESYCSNPKVSWWTIMYQTILTCVARDFWIRMQVVVPGLPCGRPFLCSGLRVVSNARKKFRAPEYIFSAVNRLILFNPRAHFTHSFYL